MKEKDKTPSPDVRLAIEGERVRPGIVKENHVQGPVQMRLQVPSMDGPDDYRAGVTPMVELRVRAGDQNCLSVLPTSDPGQVDEHLIRTRVALMCMNKEVLVWVECLTACSLDSEVLVARAEALVRECGKEGANLEQWELDMVRESLRCLGHHLSVRNTMDQDEASTRRSGDLLCRLTSIFPSGTPFGDALSEGSRTDRTVANLVEECREEHSV